MIVYLCYKTIDAFKWSILQAIHMFNINMFASNIANSINLLLSCEKMDIYFVDRHFIRQVHSQKASL